MTAWQPTFVPSLLSRGVVKLQLDLAVLPRLSSILAMRCGLVGFVVDLRAEGVSKLFGGTPTFLAQIVTLPEVFAQILVVTVDKKKVVILHK